MLIPTLTQLFQLIYFGVGCVILTVSVLLMSTPLWKRYKYLSDYCRRYVIGSGGTFLGFFLLVMSANTDIKTLLILCLGYSIPATIILTIWYYVFICPPGTNYKKYMKKRFKKE